MRFVKPLDETLLHKIFKTHTSIITIEDGTVVGGLGSAILEFASQNNYKNTIEIIGVPDHFINHGSVEELYRIIGFDSEALSLVIKKMIG